MVSKYVVMKREDWEKVRRHEFLNAEEKLLPDAEVIRKQDITSAPIFHAYSGIVLSYIEVLRSICDSVDNTQELNRITKQINQLQEVADHFHDAALSAELWPTRKLPD
jgi:hypothetical protein